MKTKLILVVLAVMLILSVAIAPVPVAASPAIVATNLQFNYPPVCKADEVLEWTCPSGYYLCITRENGTRDCFYIFDDGGFSTGSCELQCRAYGNNDSEDDDN